MKNFLHKLWQWRLTLIVVLAIIGSIGTSIVMANSQQVVVQANVLNVRKGPGLAYDVTAQVKKGQRLTVISERNEWYQVRLSETSVGWVASWLIKNTEVSATANRIGLIDQGDTPIYASNELNTQPLKQLNAGDKVTILYQEGDWLEVKYQDSVAWVQKTKVKITDQVESNAKTTNIGDTSVLPTKAEDQVAVVDTDNTALRSQPNTSANVLEHLPAKTILTYVKTVDQWYEVKTKAGKTGYVASWVVSMANRKTLEDTMPKIASNLAEATIVLDPGHGGNDVGALSQSAKYEKSYTLAIANVIESKLKAAGANVVLTRTDDSYLDLAPRAQAANQLKADAFISLHFDSSDTVNSATGITTYYYHDNRDKKLAQLLSSQLGNLPLTNRGYEFGNFQVLRDNQRPAVLLELGYINNSKDFRYITKSSYYNKVANDIVIALTNYFK
ncbi:N-acetylmuramoyl-L-alanine amidase [Lapidilactobacillus achengensis]|uniref:N-acetylmuramoyl-L-alanine amidase n=1 Tax=Lapidilactobacillus achengensis TaxID=2486000 RepID=A0ABW1UM80_9LACO|nr:N-acetylmuramoyl-L-alanine amidase [Lapidilactobacillus achengensis]